jgi:ferredoxin
VSERPDLFRFDADGISEVYGATEDVPDVADDVIAQCPVGALERADA